MAAGQIDDLKIYNDEFYGGAYEAIEQVTDAFNAASGNALQMIRKDKKGEYEKVSLFKRVQNLVNRRRMDSLAAVADTGLAQDEEINVKLMRRLGPVAESIGALKMIASSQQEISFMLGRMMGEEKIKDMLNTTILAARAALLGQSTNIFDASGLATPHLIHNHLIDAMALYGDAAPKIKVWVMHSAPFFNLMKQSVVDKITNVADVVVVQGSVATLGKPVIVTDSSALWDQMGSGSAGDDLYYVLGLCENAAAAVESEEEQIVGQVITGGEQITFRIQGEYAFNVGVRGFKYDTQYGANPTNTIIGASNSWDKVATSHKDLAGVVIKVKKALAA